MLGKKISECCVHELIGSIVGDLAAAIADGVAKLRREEALDLLFARLGASPLDAGRAAALDAEIGPRSRPVQPA